MLTILFNPFFRLYGRPEPSSRERGKADISEADVQEAFRRCLGGFEEALRNPTAITCDNGSAVLGK